MDLNKKIVNVFEGKVVRKDLTFKVKGNAVVPTYVLEYLLGQNCATDDETLITNGIEKTKETIQNHFVHRSESEFVKSKIKESGKHKIIDKITVSLNDTDNIYEASFANLGIKDIRIADNIVKEHQKLLSGGGVWCILTMAYDNAKDVPIRWIIEQVKPIQISGVDLDEYCQKRNDFSTEEWLDLLMQSIGLKPEHFNRRGKLIQLSRLLPHVENNYNFIELGPKGTGKSHIFSEMSPHGVLVSGGDVSKARLFVNNTGNRIGLVGYWDVVALDEFEQEVGSKRVDGDLVKIMQNYMANKSFNRGKDTYPATASLVFVGNTKKTVPYMLKNSNLFESIPIGYIKGAFLDRLHIYIPGWEVGILKEAYFTSDFGFIVDYLAEILKQFRNFDFSNILDEYIELDSSLTQRDKIAIKKTFSGLVKIIYPNKNMTDNEKLEIIDFAIEGRKRIKEQIYIIDETFESELVQFQYKILSNNKIINIETLEILNYGKQNNILSELSQDTMLNDNSEKENKIKEINESLKPGEIIIRDNQTGISYQKLFAPYLKGAKEIKIIDPYIRAYHQFKNLQEFCLMLSNNKSFDDEINLHVITWYKEGYESESNEIFNEIINSVADLGINLSFQYKDNHDRSIIADTGWKIKLGRGLDFFEKPDGRFDIANLYQEKRKCRNCEITFIKN